MVGVCAKSAIFDDIKCKLAFKIHPLICLLHLDGPRIERMSKEMVKDPGMPSVNIQQ